MFLKKSEGSRTEASSTEKCHENCFKNEKCKSFSFARTKEGHTACLLQYESIQTEQNIQDMTEKDPKMKYISGTPYCEGQVSTNILNDFS